MREVLIDIEPSDDGRFNVVETVRETIVKETRTVFAVFLDELHAEWFRTICGEGAPGRLDLAQIAYKIDMPDAAWAALEEDYRLSANPDFDISWTRLIERAKFEGWDLLPKDLVRGYFFDDLELAKHSAVTDEAKAREPDAPAPTPQVTKPTSPAPAEEPEPIAASGEAEADPSQQLDAQTEDVFFEHAFGLIADGMKLSDAAEHIGVSMERLRGKWAANKARFMREHRHFPPTKVEASVPIVDELKPERETDQEAVSGGVSQVLARSARQWTESDDRKLEEYEAEVGIAVAATRLSRDVSDCEKRLQMLADRREREVAREMAQ